MLTPREQIARYGKPIITLFNEPQVGTVLLKESYDRFAFCILAPPFSAAIAPIDGTGQVFSQVDLPDNGMIAFHNLTHGLAVNLGWELRSGIMIGTVTVIESFAFGSNIDLERFKESNPQRRATLHRSPTPSLPELLRSNKRKR